MKIGTAFLHQLYPSCLIPLISLCTSVKNNTLRNSLVGRVYQHLTEVNRGSKNPRFLPHVFSPSN